MAKVAREESGAHSFHCPGCKHLHVFHMTMTDGSPGWTFNADFDKPTFTPSLLNRTRTTRCHLYMREGMIEFLNDCTHELAGQTVECPDRNEEKQC